MSIHKKQNENRDVRPMVTLSRADVFSMPVSEQQASEKIISFKSFSQCIRTLLQNWRQGTLGCLGRGEVVSRSNKKPWKQKGTGRARAGSPRSPLWRGGGVTFGPQARERTLKVNKNVRKNVLGWLFEEYLDKGRVKVLDWHVEGDVPKTAQAHAALAGIIEKKIILFFDLNDTVTAASFANISRVQLMSFDSPNVYDLSNCSTWLVLQKDLEIFKAIMVGSCN